MVPRSPSSSGSSLAMMGREADDVVGADEVDAHDAPGSLERRRRAVAADDALAVPMPAMFITMRPGRGGPAASSAACSEAVSVMSQGRHAADPAATRWHRRH